MNCEEKRSEELVDERVMVMDSELELEEECCCCCAANTGH